MVVTIKSFEYHEPNPLHYRVKAQINEMEMEEKDGELYVELSLESECLKAVAGVYIKLEDLERIDPKRTGRGLVIMLDHCCYFIRWALHVIAPWVDLGVIEYPALKETVQVYRELTKGGDKGGQG